jgi:hypothetical protein
MMRHSNLPRTPEGIYHILKSEWHLSQDFRHARTSTIRELLITIQDVNWLLNTVEWQYNVEIEEGDISLDLTVADFINLILRHNKKMQRAA